MKNLSALAEESVRKYLEEGLYCSEAILQAYNAGLNLGLNEAALKMATAFGAGFGAAKCSCGSLTGALLVLSAIKGRLSGKESEAEVFQLAQRLHDRFKKEHKSICCRTLTREIVWGSPDHGPFCAKYVRSAAQFLNELIEENR